MNDEFCLTKKLDRRDVIKVGATVGAIAVASRIGVLPAMADAAADLSKWPKDAFEAKDEASVIKALFGKTATQSDKVQLDAPEIAENGAVVPITVSTTMPKTTRVSVLVLENPFTLAASYIVPDGTSANVSSRLKFAKTTKVIALVESDGAIYSKGKEVKVTVGGCGG